MRAIPIVAILAGVAWGHSRPARYYVKVRNVIEAPGVQSGFAESAAPFAG